MTDKFEHTFAKPANAEHRRQRIESQRRAFEAVAGVPLEIDEIITGPRGELTVRWRPRRDETRMERPPPERAPLPIGGSLFVPIPRRSR